VTVFWGIPLLIRLVLALIGLLLWALGVFPGPNATGIDT
jgi:hypothetical protein